MVSGSNYTRVNYKYAAQKAHPSTQRNLAPRAVLMKTGIRPLNTARPVNTAQPKTTVYSARPMLRFSKLAQSTEKSPYQTKTTLTSKNLYQKVNTAKGKLYTARLKAVNTARPNTTIVNAVKVNQVNAVKASAYWVWQPTKLNSASITFKRHNYVDARGKSKSVMAWTSKPLMDDMLHLGDEPKVEESLVKELLKLMCDKKISVLFTDTGCFVMSSDFKLADESLVLLKVPRKNNMYSVDMKSIVPKKSLTCLVAKATLDESMLWHRRLGHGKQHKASFVAGTNSNDFLDGSLFDSSSKNANNDEPQPSNDAGKKDDEGGIDNQERPEKSAQDVNTVGPSINTASTNDNTGSLNINTGSPIVTTAPTETTHADYFEDETEVDMSNISTTYPVPSTPNTRIHKDHSLDNVIGDVQSSVQTRRMTKTTNDQGFISAVYEGKTHEDLHTCLFACFLSQEEPKRIAKALSDSAWVEAMQEELLQFKLQKVWILVDLPKGKRAIGTKWIFRNKKDESGIVIRNKARLVAQGYTQEESIDYDKVFAPVARIKAIRLFLAYASFMIKRCQAQLSTPMNTEKPLLKDSNGDDVDVNIYRYLKGQPKLGLWYPRDSPFDLVAYSDSVYAGASLDRKSTIRGCQFLGCRLISW
ncbi:putative ribonuclease H-like domain-containing protein [Tanacetum coccineum]